MSLEQTYKLRYGPRTKSEQGQVRNILFVIVFIFGIKHCNILLDAIDKVGQTSQPPYCFKCDRQKLKLLAFYRHGLIIFNLSENFDHKKSKTSGEKSQIMELCGRKKPFFVSP